MDYNSKYLHVRNKKEFRFQISNIDFVEAHKRNTGCPVILARSAFISRSGKNMEKTAFEYKDK